MTLTLGDYAVIAALLSTIVGMPVTMLGMSVKGLHKRVAKTEEQLDGLKEDKVNKKDWLRVEMSTRQKVDTVSEKLTALSSRLEAEWGMAAAMSRVGEQIGKLVEKVAESNNAKHG